MENEHDFKNTYKRLADKISSLLKEEETRTKEKDRKGENFNVFKVMGMEHDETRMHSAILACLLDPNHKHGCEDAFLKLFLNQINGLKRYADNVKNATIDTERSIGNKREGNEKGGRLDIVITLTLNDNKTILIIIENKIYAADQEKQLVRYYNYANEEKKKGHCSDFHLFYLNLFGSEPSDISTKGQDIELKSDEQYSIITYRDDILAWLLKCAEKAQDKPRVSETIYQYTNTIKSLTNQDMEENIKKEICELATENEENLKVALAINSNYKEILNAACEKNLKKTFDNIANEKGMSSPKLYHIPWSNIYSGIELYKDSWNKVQIGFEFMQNNMRGFSYGIKFRSENAETNDEVKKLIIEKKGEESSSSWWPWRRFFICDGKDYTDFNKEDVIRDLYDGTMEKTIKKLVDELIEEVEEYNK